MKISAFTQIIVTVAVTAWVFILPVMAVATILVLELALLLSIKHDRMTMAAIGGLAVFTGLMVLLQLLFGSPLEIALVGGLRMLVMTMAFLCMLAAGVFVHAGSDENSGHRAGAGDKVSSAVRIRFYADNGAAFCA